MRKDLLLLAVFCMGGMIPITAQNISKKALSSKNASKVVIRSGEVTNMEKVSIQASSKDENLVKMQKAKRLFSAGDVKILSTKKMSDGTELQLVEDVKGQQFKRIVSNRINEDRIISNNSLMTKAEAKATAATNTLFESFEGYDGKAFDWIPSTWSEKNIDGNVPDQGAKTNYTWHAVGTQTMFPAPSDGKYHAMIPFAYITGENDEMIGIPQDEWLISPTFTPKANEKFYFDLAYAPIFIYDVNEFDFDTWTWKKKVISATMKTLISVDGGEWKTLLDVADIVKGMSDDELWNYTDVVYYTFGLKLTDYVGKNVKIAFEYVGTNGNTMAVDAVRVGLPNVTALYRRPEGYLYKGTTKEFRNSTALSTFGPAYEDAKWLNFSSKDAESFAWEFTDPSFDGSNMTMTDINPTIKYPWASFLAPKLTARAEGVADQTYSLSGDNNLGIIETGGDNTITLNDNSVLETGVGNYNPQGYLTTSRFAAGKYCFGTGSADIWGGIVDEIGNYFEKPAHKYWFDEIWLDVYALDADPNAEFTLIIRRVNEQGTLKDTIATAICYASEALKQPLSGGGTAYNLPFKFKKVDPDTGREEDTYIEISDAMIILLKGMNSSKVREFAPMNQYYDNPTYESNVYFYCSVPQEGGTFKRTGLLSGSNMLSDFYSSFRFNMNASFSFLFAEDPKFDVPVAGGTKTVPITCCYNSNGWWIDEDIPEWINMAVSDPTKANSFTMTAQALPSGVTGRSFDFTLRTFGAEQEFHITQGQVTGMEAIETMDIKVISNGDNFILNYPEGVTNVTIMNVAGQMFATYSLPSTGQYIIPTGNLNRGLYILKFNESKIVKVIK